MRCKRMIGKDIEQGQSVSAAEQEDSSGSTKLARVQ